MIWFAFGLLAICLLFSAFFSGSETGFYRASRARIVMNAIRGNWLDGFVLMLTNQPALLVATVLIGNNIANYGVSLAIVLGAREMFSGNNAIAELIAPLLMTPFLFVYGESFPKSMFFQAPVRLLRRAAPLLAVCTVLLSPAVLILWGLSRAVEWGLGQSPEQVRLSLGRREMEKVLDESQEIGLLHPAQRSLSQNFFLIAARSVKSMAVPAAKIATVPAGKPAAVYIEAGRKQPYGIVLVTSQETGAVTGYVRLVDLLVWSDRKKPVTEWFEILDIPAEETAGEALMQMQARHHKVARVRGSGQQSASFLFRDMLIQPLFREPIGTGLRASEPVLGKS